METNKKELFEGFGKKFVIDEQGSKSYVDTVRANKRIDLFTSTVFHHAPITCSYPDAKKANKYLTRTKAKEWNTKLQSVLGTAGTARSMHLNNPEQQVIIYFKIQSTSSSHQHPLYLEIPSEIDYRDDTPTARTKVIEEMQRLFNVLDLYYMVVLVDQHPDNADDPRFYKIGKYSDFGVKDWKVIKKNESVSDNPRYDRIIHKTIDTIRPFKPVGIEYKNVIQDCTSILKT